MEEKGFSELKSSTFLMRIFEKISVTNFTDIKYFANIVNAGFLFFFTKVYFRIVVDEGTLNRWRRLRARICAPLSTFNSCFPFLVICRIILCSAKNANVRS